MEVSPYTDGAYGTGACQLDEERRQRHLRMHRIRLEAGDAYGAAYHLASAGDLERRIKRFRGY
jgi:hypothetical protein